MTVLIIEDSIYKLKDLIQFFREQFPDWSCISARAFQTGVKRMVDEKPDLVILDMSLPTFEGTISATGDDAGRERIYGGRDILAEMSFMAITIPVIIISQFDYFDEAPHKVEFKALVEELMKEYKNVIGHVFYDNLNTKWGPALHQQVSAWKHRHENSAS